MSADILLWWLFLCTVSGINILAWSISAAAIERRKSALSADMYWFRRAQLLLSAGYVLGCAFRSVFPVFDVPRIVMHDSWLSSVIIGRSVATFAEVCFIAQWALLVRELSRGTGSHTGRIVSRVVVPLIIVAETCSWHAVLTTSNLGHVLEEAIWGLCAVLLVTSFATAWPRCNPSVRPLLAAWCAAGVAYVMYMFLVDVPMYWTRWLADEANGRQYLGIAEGALDAGGRWTVSHRWDDWKDEIAWMSIYFSAAVWMSIALVHAPGFGRHGAAGGNHTWITLPAARRA